jgi:hypothetical protein
MHSISVITVLDIFKSQKLRALAPKIMKNMLVMKARRKVTRNLIKQITATGRSPHPLRMPITFA